MAYLPNPTSKSDSLGTILIAYLYVGLAVVSLSLLFSLIELIAPDIYLTIEILDGLTSVIQLLMIGLAAILFLTWMYQVHADLKALFRTYPITSGQALAQLAIPIYNLWGIWNVFATLADRLKSHGGESAAAGSTLRFWLPLLYIVTFATRIVNRFVILEQGQAEHSSPTTLLLVSVGLEVFLWFIWVEMVKVIRQAIRDRFTAVQASVVQGTMSA
jgi:hypothetical protein